MLPPWYGGGEALTDLIAGAEGDPGPRLQARPAPRRSGRGFAPPNWPPAAPPLPGEAPADWLLSTPPQLGPSRLAARLTVPPLPIGRWSRLARSAPRGASPPNPS